MPSTYEPIGTTTLGSSAQFITFSSIPQTYTDLRLVWCGTTTGADTWWIRFNGSADGGSAYSTTAAYSFSTSTGSNGSSSQPQFNPSGGSSTSTTDDQLFIMDINGYSNNGGNKTPLMQWAAGNSSGSSSYVFAIGNYNSSSAITSIRLGLTSNSFATGCVATLYGIKRA